MAKVKINFVVGAEVHRDKVTKTWLYTHKKYNISGYGKTRKEAKEMFLFCINDILIFKPPNEKQTPSNTVLNIGEIPTYTRQYE